MAPLDLLIHLLSLLAPAIGVGLLVALAGPWVVPRKPVNRPWWMHAAINFVAGGVVLTAGLGWWGSDGKMATYTVMVGAIATCQWLFSGAWRA